MPPAFNLSQDQTLQFHTCWLPSPAAPCGARSLNSLTGPFLRTYLFRLLCEHLIYLFTPRQPVTRLPRLPSSAHTYRLLIVKEPVLLRRIFCLALRRESLCSPAAEKRDYAAFPV